MEAKVNYLIGTWSGLRNKAEFDDTILKRHLEKLDRVKHSLVQISIGHPDNPDEKPWYTEWISSLKETSGGIPIKVHKFPNVGRSYGQWSRLFEIYRNQFTHFIFVEDDYVPVKDDFDQILVDMFEERAKKKKCGFLCGLIFDNTGRFGMIMNERHAAISNGISSNEVLNKVWKIYGCLPHDKQGYDVGQILFSTGFYKAGYTIEEYIDQFRCLYWQHNEQMRWYWDGKHNEDLIVPIQFLDNPDMDFIEYRPDSFPVNAPKPEGPPKRGFQIEAQQAQQVQNNLTKKRQIAVSIGRRRALGY